jgi:hypothetical protein
MGASSTSSLSKIRENPNEQVGLSLANCRSRHRAASPVSRASTSTQRPGAAELWRSAQARGPPLMWCRQGEITAQHSSRGRGGWAGSFSGPGMS